MEIIKGMDLKENKGRFGLIYGASEVGKSTSCIESMPKKLLVLNCEKRNPDSSFEAIEDKYPNIRNEVDFGLLQKQEELLDTLHLKILKTAKDGIFIFNNTEYRSLLVDSLSHFLNVEVITEMEDQTKKAEIFKIKRDIIDSYRLDELAYGSLASIGHRICSVLKMISQQGIFVVTTASGVENPKWNRALVYAPGFAGKKFGNEFLVHLDFCGMIHQRTDEQGEVLYPPMVSFKSPNNDFVAKYTGKHLKTYTGIFNFEKIFPEMYK